MKKSIMTVIERVRLNKRIISDSLGHLKNEDAFHACRRILLNKGGPSWDLGEFKGRGILLREGAEGNLAWAVHYGILTIEEATNR